MSVFFINLSSICESLVKLASHLQNTYCHTNTFLGEKTGNLPKLHFTVGGTDEGVFGPLLYSYSFSCKL